MRIQIAITDITPITACSLARHSTADLWLGTLQTPDPERNTTLRNTYHTPQTLYTLIQMDRVEKMPPHAVASISLLVRREPPPALRISLLARRERSREPEFDGTSSIPSSV